MGAQWTGFFLVWEELALAAPRLDFEGWGRLGVKESGGRVLPAQAGRWQHEVPRGLCGAQGAGEVSGVPIPRVLSAK